MFEIKIKVKTHKVLNLNTEKFNKLSAELEKCLSF